jgi:hypothetical protein
MRRTARIAAGALAAAAGWALVYRLGLRAWCLTWGATAAEAAEPLPGDDLLPDAEIVATRAITIDAPPGAVWPWLAQMGSGRAGAYTYDWIENLFGLGMHSADEILPEHQDVKVGDAFRLGPGRPFMRFEVVEPGRALVVRFEDGTWVWSFVLRAVDGGTRLLSRNRIATPGGSFAGRLVTTYLMEPGSLVMERKMLLGIRSRAERLVRRSAC